MKVTVISGYPVIRQGISAILSSQKDIVLTEDAETLNDAFTVLKTKKPDIAILDANIGSKSGLDIISKARNISIGTKFIIMGIFENREFFKKALKMRVEGHLLREAQPDEIIYAVNQVHRGKKYFDSEILEYINNKEQLDMHTNLTNREKEVLLKLGQGCTNKEIAEEFYITEHTVKKHVSRILTKLDLQDRVQVAIFLSNHSASTVVQ